MYPEIFEVVQFLKWVATEVMLEEDFRSAGVHHKASRCEVLLQDLDKKTADDAPLSSGGLGGTERNLNERLSFNPIYFQSAGRHKAKVYREPYPCHEPDANSDLGKNVIEINRPPQPVHQTATEKAHWIILRTQTIGVAIGRPPQQAQQQQHGQQRQQEPKGEDVVPASQSVAVGA
ncbi:hypothetical protein BKA70DRAFT_1240478 [Coprinopsis sp. MPI-PUGE-AT-0042]|nr:hypothetical protein BKA70DRAFT_1240478 [Coprinopsis sp. MPI-PUGE-AT-0042]